MIKGMEKEFRYTLMEFTSGNEKLKITNNNKIVFYH